uniref:phenylalanine--tRNA ligase n=1 Tax=Toxarium undulatum TaxID=210620 RepID=A0A1D8D9K4_9STRA|nr:phenylalanine-tRNA ligase beta subunit [Toxarium undulatum]AOS86636.1 phenylalanine-tRNA ligase beta subunit [Toxarium undulatum]
MQISLYWLNELLNLRGYNIKFLIERLTVNGFEVEECKKVIAGKKISVSIIFSTTANRGDVLSIRGIAKEVRLITERIKKIRVVPHVRNVQATKYHFRLRRALKRVTYYGGESFYRPRRIRYNIVKINRILLRHKRIKKTQLNEFKWRIENTIYRSHKWKRNRLYYSKAVFNTNEPKIYSKFVCWVIEDLKNLTSPQWLQKKLIYSGFVPQNNINDFQNYILLEGGYPFELYDFEKIKLGCQDDNFKLKLDSAGYKQFFAVNKSNYVLNHETLVLKANDEILSVAGIVPSIKYAHTDQTTSFLIEGCIYNSRMIRQQSRLLGLKTTRSIYYSRGGMNRDFLLDSWYRLLLLLKVSNPNMKCTLHTTNYSAQKEEQIYHIPFTTRYHKEELIQRYDMWIREKRLAQIFGPAYTYNPITRKQFQFSNRILSTHIEYYFQRLKIIYMFSKRPGARLREYWPTLYGDMPVPPPPLKNWWKANYSPKEGRYWVIEIPKNRRHDLKREIDIIEEICRLYGVDKMTSILPNESKQGTEDSSYQIRKKITLCLLNEGFTELVSYSLVSGKTKKNKQHINLINPLSLDYSSLRTTLLPNLINIVNENIKQGNNVFEGFECGHVFSKDFYGNYIEKENLAGIFGGVKLKSRWSDKSNNLSWFEAKGKMEQIFEKFNIVVLWESSNIVSDSKILHPYRTAYLYLSNKQFLGVFGQINPILSKSLNIPQHFYLFELDFKVLVLSLKNTLKFAYKRYSLYPRIIKDLSFIVDKSISFNTIKESIYAYGSKFLVDVKLLDNYQSSSMNSNEVSLCIQLIFQSYEKTLKTEDIESDISEISLVLVDKYNIFLRN